jgi:hypothetical protein
MPKLVLRETPNAFYCTQGCGRLFNGSDGYLYTQADLTWLASRYGAPKVRKVKYGENLTYTTT